MRVPVKEQLANFAHQLEFYSHKEQKTPKDWMEALFMLRKYLETLKQEYIKKGKTSTLVL